MTENGMSVKICTTHIATHKMSPRNEALSSTRDILLSSVTLFAPIRASGARCFILLRCMHADVIGPVRWTRM